jgi:hypothetical protein
MLVPLGLQIMIAVIQIYSFSLLLRFQIDINKPKKILSRASRLSDHKAVQVEQRSKEKSIGWSC